MDTTTNATHTPGPWTTDGAYILADAHSPGSWVAGVNRMGAGDYKANARLIAAAPTMADYIRKQAEAGCAEARKILESLS